MNPAELLHISVTSIHPSPFQPRTMVDEGRLAELVADVKARGILSPVLVRQSGHSDDEYELVYGHRRLEAARQAGLTTIPALVGELSDVESLEAALAENIARDDLHPLELASGLQRLHVEHKVPLEDLAERIGKSESSVRAAIKLMDLEEKPRALFREGKLSASTALLVARIPDAKLQAEAAKKIADGKFDQGPLSYRDALDLIQREYMLGLKDAPFDPKDAALVPAAGACPACPKRTGAQPDLFKDVPGADVCTDLPCYRAKSDAAWVLKQAASKAGTGPKTLSATEGKKVIDRWGRVAYDVDYVEPETTCGDDPKRRSYKQLLGKHAKGAIVLARGEDGKEHQLLPRAELKELLKDAGHDFKRAAADPAMAEHRERLALEKKRRERQQKVARKVAAAAATTVEAKEPDRKLWQLLAHVFASEPYAIRDTLVRRTGTDLDEEHERYLGKLPDANEGVLRGFVAECVLERVLYTQEKEMKAVATYFKVDLEEVGKEVRAEEKAAAAEKEKPKEEKTKPAAGVEKVAKKVRAIAKRAKEQRA